MRVKIFSGTDKSKMEENINEWLADLTKINVLRSEMSTCVDPEYVFFTITIWYESKRAAKKATPA